VGEVRQKGTHRHRMRVRLRCTAPVPQLVAALSSPDPVVRRHATWTLGGMESGQMSTALAHLKNVMDEPDIDIRKWAGWALEMVTK